VLRPFVNTETYRALLFYLAELVLGIVGFTLIVTGWALTAGFAITPLVVPLLIGLRMGVGQLANAEAALARELLGTRARPPAQTPGPGFWSRGFNVLKDQAFWRQQAHLLLAWPIALIPLVVLSLAVQLVTLPIWYRWTDGADVFWRSNVDTFAETLPFLAIGLVLLVLLAHLLVPLTRLSRTLVSSLLTGDGVARSPAEARALRHRTLAVHTAASVLAALVLVAIWAGTGPAYFWPIWALLSLAFVLGAHAWVVYVVDQPGDARFAARKALAIHIGVAALLLAFLVGIWAAAGGGYFWPIWVLLGLAVTVVAHVAATFIQREYRRSHRIERLETSRAGVVDVQEAELRRIERDLHDGAQARLVALGMSLGMAEQKLDSDPEAVRELLAEARRGAGEALDELRDLARGIHPPILTDRGLEPAVAALVSRSPVPVRLSVDTPTRPAAAVETAAYFVVAEALTNVIKHADAAHVDIRIERKDGLLVAEIVDDGRGGVNLSGPGLTGLRQRVEALDGALLVTSPAGGPTTVRAELPCAS
jgi:signal transduction histidine kinase